MNLAKTNVVLLVAAVVLAVSIGVPPRRIA